MRRARGVLCAVAVSMIALWPSAMRGAGQAADDALVKKARAIHDQVIALDTHVDIEPDDFTAGRNYTQRLETQVNLPKMTEGGLDAIFMVVYVGQPSLQSTPDAFEPAGYDRAYKSAIAKFDAIHRLTEKIAPDRIQLALTAADVRRINASGKKVALIGVENGYPIGTDLARASRSSTTAARATCRSRTTATASCPTRIPAKRDGWKWNGLSPLGKQVDRRAQSRGHHDRRVASLESLDDAGDRAVQGADHRLALVGAGALQSQPQPGRRAAAGAQEERRRGPDRGLRELRQDHRHARAGRGARPRCARSSASRPTPRSAGAVAGWTRRVAAAAARRRRPRAAQRGAPRAAATNGSTEVTRQVPAAAAAPPSRTSSITSTTSSRRSASITSASRRTSTAAAASTGWNDASETFNVTLELVRRGYTEEQIGKIWSGNLLRVMEQVAKIAAQSATAGGR